MWSRTRQRTYRILYEVWWRTFETNLLIFETVPLALNAVSRTDCADSRRTHICACRTKRNACSRNGIVDEARQTLEADCGSQTVQTAIDTLLTRMQCSRVGILRADINTLTLITIVGTVKIGLTKWANESETSLAGSAIVVGTTNASSAGSVA